MNRSGPQNRQLKLATNERHVALGSHHGGIIAPTTARSEPEPGWTNRPARDVVTHQLVDNSARNRLAAVISRHLVENDTPGR